MATKRVHRKSERIIFRNEHATAAYLAISVETLRHWRRLGRGPRFRKIGRCVRYHEADLQAFVEAAPSGGQPIA
jgi:hypothetical protein